MKKQEKGKEENNVKEEDISKTSMDESIPKPEKTEKEVKDNDMDETKEQISVVLKTSPVKKVQEKKKTTLSPKQR